MGSPIRGMGQPIQGPIMRRLVCRVYFLHKSIKFHDMQTECQIIKASCSFLTVLPISHKFRTIFQSLSPLSLPDHSPIAPSSAEDVLSNLLLASDAANFNPPSKISFPDPVPSSVNEPYH